jgi:hypothetical protein
MKLSHFVVVAFLSASLAGASFAQPAQPASSPRMGPGSGMGSGSGMEAGPGHNNKASRFGWNNKNTTGWSLMTPQERTAHQTKMRAVTTYDECKTLLEENHKMMEVRAKEKGVKLPTPRQNGCEVMKTRGFIK